MRDAFNLIQAAVDAHDDTEYDGKYRKLANAALILGAPSDDKTGVRVVYKGYHVRLCGDYESKECTNVQVKRTTDGKYGATRCIKTDELARELRKIKQEIDAGRQVTATVEPGSGRLTLKTMHDLIKRSGLKINKYDSDSIKAGTTGHNAESKFWVFTHEVSHKVTWALGYSEAFDVSTLDQAQRVVQICSSFLNRKISDLETVASLLNKVYKNKKFSTSRSGNLCASTTEVQATVEPPARDLVDEVASVLTKEFKTPIRAKNHVIDSKFDDVFAVKSSGPASPSLYITMYVLGEMLSSSRIDTVENTEWFCKRYKILVQAYRNGGVNRLLDTMARERFPITPAARSAASRLQEQTRAQATVEPQDSNTSFRQRFWTDVSQRSGRKIPGSTKTVSATLTDGSMLQVQEQTDKHGYGFSIKLYHGVTCVSDGAVWAAYQHMPGYTASVHRVAGWLQSARTATALGSDYGLLPVPGKPGHYNETGDSRVPGVQVVETPAGVDVSVNGKPAGKLSGSLEKIRKAIEAKKIGPTTKNEGGIADTQVLATVEPGNHAVTQDKVVAFVKQRLQGIHGLKFDVDKGQYYVTIDVTTGETSQACLDLNVQEDAYEVGVWRTQPESGKATAIVFKAIKLKSSAEFLEALAKACAHVRTMLGHQAVATVEPTGGRATRADVGRALNRGLHGLNPKLDFSVNYVTAEIPGSPYCVSVAMLSGLHSVTTYKGKNSLKNERFRTDDRAGLLRQIKLACDEVKKLVG